MTERDVFESRLRAALLRHVADGPTEFDALGFARAVAVKDPRRHGFAATLTWRGLAVGRRAWVVLLLAGLLAAIVGVVLIAGSQPQRKLPAVVPSVVPAFVCPPGSTPDEPGPVDQARPPVFSGMAFDRRAGRLVTLSDTETWTFDVCTNTWLRMHPTRKPPTSPVGLLVYDVDSDVTIGVFGPDEDPGNMWVYDLEADTWRETGPFAPFADPTFASLRFYDPISGRVVARGDDGDDGTLDLALWGYEVETDRWTQFSQTEPLIIGPHYEFFAYDASVDRLVAHATTWEAGENLGWQVEAKTWLFDLRAGTWSGTDAVTPSVFDAGMWGRAPGIAYDEAARETVMMGQGYSAAYEATTDRWEMLYATPPEEGACGTRPECRQANDMLYDSVNERLVVYGGSVYRSTEGWIDPDDLMAFDTRTRAWTVLLEASRQ